jgi:hypothetical protein
MTGPSIRDSLLRHARGFVAEAAKIAAVRRIALIGSVMTAKRDPKDIDLLVAIDGAADLAPLAAAGRRLMGRCQGLNRGADIFLADASTAPGGRYIGRLCRWRQCAPFIRRACRALNCGRREYLYDDLEIVTLAPELVREPPLELFHQVVRRAPVPEDVETVLLAGFDKMERGVDGRQGAGG